MVPVSGTRGAGGGEGAPIFGRPHRNVAPGSRPPPPTHPPPPTPHPPFQSSAERAAAEEALAAFRGSGSIAACKSLLDASASPYARLLAASSLLKTVTDGPPLDLAVRLEMRAYFPPYLESRAPTLPPFVAAAIVQLIARLVKLSWYDEDAFRTVADEGAAMLGRARARQDAAAYAVGLKLLAGLVAEFNAPCPGRTLTQHR